MASEPQLILHREPAAWAGTIMAVVAVISGFFLTISPETQGLIQAAVNAVLALIVGLRVRPLAPALFTGVLQTALPLLVVAGLDWTSEQQALLLAASGLVLNMVLIRPQVTPRSPFDSGTVVSPTGEVERP